MRTAYTSNIPTPDGLEIHILNGTPAHPATKAVAVECLHLVRRLGPKAFASELRVLGYKPVGAAQRWGGGLYVVIED